MRASSIAHTQVWGPDPQRARHSATTSRDLKIGHCYATKYNQVRKIVGFDGGIVMYVVGHKGTFPIWDKRRWCSLLRPVFMAEIAREVQAQ